ncbi:hypothetical protein SUGI_0750840 [Cryptomeria japonica]|nr:hypothetical protein SUGI_0750840 [Cryptomeria japonica]
MLSQEDGHGRGKTDTSVTLEMCNELGGSRTGYLMVQTYFTDWLRLNKAILNLNGTSTLRGWAFCFR